MALVPRAGLRILSCPSPCPASASSPSCPSPSCPSPSSPPPSSPPPSSPPPSSPPPSTSPPRSRMGDRADRNLLAGRTPSHQQQPPEEPLTAAGPEPAR
ncbi:unnamed protein product [Diplocarpon coronariae]